MFDMKMNEKKTNVSFQGCNFDQRYCEDWCWYHQTNWQLHVFGTNYNIKWKMWWWIDFVKIIEIARGAFNSILKTLTARHINMKTRKRIIKALCVVDTFIRMWNVDNNHLKYDKIAIVWNVGISEDDENILEGKENKWRSPNTGRRTALHNSNNKEKKNYPLLVTWSDVTTSTDCCWRVHWRGKKQRKAENGVVLNIACK